MYRAFVWAAIIVANVYAKGEFIVLHSPSNVQFTGNETIKQSLLKDVFSAALGFSVESKGTWSGMKIQNPWDYPEAVVVIAIEGVDSLESPKGIIYPLDVDEVEETTWQALSGRIQKMDDDNKMVRLCVADGLNALGQSALGELKPNSTDERSLKSLRLSEDEHRKFLEEINLLHAIAVEVASTVVADKKPDVYWLVVSGLRPPIEPNSNDMEAAKEALALLNLALSDITTAFKKAYSDKVLVTAVTNDARSGGLARQRRDVNTGTIKDDNDKNDKTTENPPAMTIFDNIKSDDGEESEKIKEEETKTVDIGEGSNLKKSDENTSDNENDETKEQEQSTSTEANDSRDTTSTIKSSEKLDDTTLNNDHSNTDTENTNRLFKMSDLKLGLKYNDSYPAIFNIMLWFGVVFFFSLLAICIAIADMDPGRDSIIYRMTSNRMKKDN